MIGVHQAGIDNSSRLISNALVVRGASAGRAMVKLDAFVIPHVDSRGPGFGEYLHLVRVVVRPSNAQSPTDRAIAFSDRSRF